MFFVKISSAETGICLFIVLFEGIAWKLLRLNQAFFIISANKKSRRFWMKKKTCFIWKFITSTDKWARRLWIRKERKSFHLKLVWLLLNLSRVQLPGNAVHCKIIHSLARFSKSFTNSLANASFVDCCFAFLPLFFCRDARAHSQ